MQAPEQEVVVDARSATRRQTPPQTWYSFFTEMLPSVSLAAPQTRQLQRLPDVGVESVEMYRVHGVALSTGNVWQLLALRILFPDRVFNSPLQENNIESFKTEYQNSNVWRFLYCFDDSNEEYLRLLRNLLECFRGELATYDGINSDDDLPTKIAKTIANTYYKELELTVADIQTAITSHYNEEFKLDHINDEFVKCITHVMIDNGRMELRTLLPYEEIVKVAVDELKHPPLTLENAIAWMKAVLEQLAEWFTDCIGYDASPSNP